MGFQEIKEEVISRKLLNYSDEIHTLKPLINEMLIGLSRKNIFLTAVRDYSNDFNVREFSIFLESLLEGKGDEYQKKLYYEENFDGIIQSSIEWIKGHTKENKI
ncbi:MAG: hypothetical protein M1323_01185 [Candidatus Thermoplasmatota archaeon]|nr:hypothetical protein [Candidatus Thermoplasmatota archaeon]